MTQARLREYERLLRRLRADPRLWTDDKVGELIAKVKSHCAKDWQARSNALKARADEMFAFRTL